MPNKEITTLVSDPALKCLCTSLGKIPVGDEFHPNSSVPIDWDILSKVDWEELVSNLQDQRLAPVVYWTLSRSGEFSSIPKLARYLLRESYFATWAMNQNFFRGLEQIAREYKTAGIPLVALKGACYARTIYADSGLRPMTDLDVLVPGSKINEAVHIAELMGYKETELEHKPVRLRDMSHHVSMQKTDPPLIRLELHKDLVAAHSYKYAVPVDWFWSQTEPMGGTSSKGQFEGLLMLTPAAQVLYASAHALLEHGGMETRLLWFFDLDRLIRYYGDTLDWNMLLSQSKVFEWGSALEAAFAKTIACFGTPIPEKVLSSLAGISDRNKKFIMRKEVRPTTDLVEQVQTLLSLKASARIRYFLGILIPTPVYIRWRFQPKTAWQIPLYYLMHWWHILRSGFYVLISIVKKGIPNGRV
jgi:hypothetical protein